MAKRPVSSHLVAACRRLASSLAADGARANSEPTKFGRDKTLWAADLRNLANTLVVTIGSLGLMHDQNGERVQQTAAYRKAREKWEFLTERKWVEPLA